MFLRSRSYVKASMVLTRADHFSIHNYIRSLLNIILIAILMVLTRLKPASYCLYEYRLSQLSHTIMLVMHVCFSFLFLFLVILLYLLTIDVLLLLLYISSIQCIGIPICL